MRSEVRQQQNLGSSPKKNMIARLRMLEPTLNPNAEPKISHGTSEQGYIYINTENSSPKARRI